MSIETDKTTGAVTFYCDQAQCQMSEIYETDGDFKEALVMAKSDGWVSERFSGDWMHVCPACSEWGHRG